MVTLAHKTPPRLDAPAYADPADGTMIHRFIGTEFAEDFVDAAKRFALKGNADQEWRRTDRFGKHANGLPTLRLPLHNAFHKVCVEASCDELGRPALHPRRVASAGFVVRKGTPDRPLGWVLDNGRPLGWRAVDKADAEPDHRRRLVNAGLLPERKPSGRYSGEETYPLRALLVDAPAAPGGRPRKRTLLHGLLPLSGRAPVPPTTTLLASETGSGRLGELPWPFGSWTGGGQTPARDTDAFTWRRTDGLQVHDGRPERAFVELLRILLERYRIAEPGERNEELRGLLSGILIRTGIARPDPDATGDPDLSDTRRFRVEGTLLAYVEARADTLLAHARAESAAFAENPGHTPGKLPGLDIEDVYVTEAAAQDLRVALVRRGEAAEADFMDSLAMPRYQQGPEEIFFVRPFLRWIDECGCERLVWGPPSAPFRVTSPFDPEATPPNVIELPDLDDIRRGVARGVSLVAPKSLAEAMDQVKPDMSMEKKSSFNIPLCASYAFSFSLPAISICAMILLMIVIGLLDLIFRWIPWVFLRLSLRCR